MLLCCCSSLEAYNEEIEELKREMQQATQTAQAIRWAARQPGWQAIVAGRHPPNLQRLSLCCQCMPSVCDPPFAHPVPRLLPCCLAAAACREDLARLEHRGAALDSAEPCARCGRSLHALPPSSAGAAGGALTKLYLFPTGNAFHGSCLCAEVADLAPAVQRQRIQRLAERLAGVPEGAATAPATSDAPAAPVEQLRQQLEEEVAVEDPFCGEIVVRHIAKPFIPLEEEREQAGSWAL